jgi:hypothetical protein
MPRQTQRIQAGSKLIEALNPGRKLVCPGYTRRDKSWFEFELTAKTRFGVIYEVTDTIHNVPAKGLRFCAGLGYRFKTFSGRPARRAKLPDGTLGFVGLLPACTEEDSPGEAVASGPCVSSIDEVKRSGKVTTTIHALIPAKAQTDPWGAG